MGFPESAETPGPARALDADWQPIVSAPGAPRRPVRRWTDLHVMLKMQETRPSSRRRWKPY